MAEISAQTHAPRASGTQPGASQLPRPMETRAAGEDRVWVLAVPVQVYRPSLAAFPHG